MRKKLSSESDAPLRLPLLYASAVLFGKGITDSIITVLKSVSGVSKEPLGDHAAMFVLDAVCMVAGINVKKAGPKRGGVRRTCCCR